MIKEPETYAELVRVKKCYDLAKYYAVTESILDHIYEFLLSNPEGQVKCTKDNISLILGTNIIETISTYQKNSQIDGLVMSDKTFYVIPHYTSGSGGYSSGGSSSNNNNNNNNNNNR